MPLGNMFSGSGLFGWAIAVRLLAAGAGTHVPFNRFPATFGPRASVLGVIKSVPFEARFDETETQPPLGTASAETITGAVFRDSAGRVRMEFRVSRERQRTYELVAISDFGARTAIALDPQARVATRLTDMGAPPGGAVSLSGWAFRGPWSVKPGAEEKTIGGVLCKMATPDIQPGASRTAGSLSGEIWISDEIKYSVLEHVTDARGTHTWRLFDIRRVEPPSSLFVVPPGYSEVVRPKLDRPPGRP